MVVGDLVYIPSQKGHNPYEIVSIEDEWITAENKFGHKKTVSRYTARKLHDVIAVLYRMYRRRYTCDVLSTDDFRMWDRNISIMTYIMNDTLTMFDYHTTLRINVSLCDPGIFDKIQEFLDA